MNKEIPSKGERSRQAILDAAYALFIQQGYAATSMRQIAEGAGLALGGIYNHFASKELIFEAIVLERHPYRQIMPLLSQANGANAEEFVRDAAQRLVVELSLHPDLLHLMLIEMVEFKGAHTQRLFELIFPQAIAVAERFQSFRPGLRDISAPLLMRAFLGMFFSYYITDLVIGKSIPPEMNKGALDGFVDIFLHGIISSTSALAPSPCSALAPSPCSALAPSPCKGEGGG